MSGLLLLVALWGGRRVIADTPPPAAVVGTWAGDSLQNFGLANPSVQNSYECLQGGVVSSRPQTLTITAAGNVTTSALPSQSFLINGGLYVVPAAPASAWTWAGLDEATGILQLRPDSAPDSIQCYFLAATATTVSIVDVGGAAVTRDWTLQCNASTYTAFGATLLTAPACTPLPGGFSPANSTVLLSVGGGPSAAAGAEAASAIATGALLVAALLGGGLAL